jgi:nicotinamide-nucleotide amidase
MSGETGNAAKSSSSLSAEIVTTGTEILLGEIVDTNAAWIAQQLRDAGINLYFKTTVGDNEQRVRSVVELGLSRSDIVIVSGGLGPTTDDITRQAIAAATNRPLRLDDSALDTLRERFARFGVRMTDNNRQQALIPEGALLIENPVGTAPGFIVETARGTVVAIPGVPREMKHLMSESVLPYLRSRAGNTGTIRRRVLRTVGIGESTLDDVLGELMLRPNPTIGLAAHTAQADIRITARADSAVAADAMITQTEAEIRERVGAYIYSSTPDETFEAAVVRELQAVAACVSIVETNSQGAIAQRMSSALAEYNPLCEQWVLGGDRPVPAPIQDVAQNVDDASRYQEEQACAIASLLIAETGATYGVAVLGSAGVDEGVYGSEAGRTWLGVASAASERSLLCPFGGQDEYTIVRIGNQALRLLWDTLKIEP